MSDDRRPVFLSGATGFIGGNVYPHLRREGFEVRCATRSVEKARSRHPEREWVEFDVDRPDTLYGALDGCESALYLIHEMGSGEGYRQREREAALAFRQAAEEVGLERIVYLGGVKPKGEPSEHLASRLETGEILRDGSVSTVELRASMIIGSGSASWHIVRDLAARLPVMLLPRWTRSSTEPVYIDDVVVALVAALTLKVDGSTWFDLPGPEALTIEEILSRTAVLLGNDPIGVGVPLLSPKLSSHWLRFVTRGDIHLAQELVKGLETDLLAESDEFWRRIDHLDRISFDNAVRRTLHEDSPGSKSARAYEALVRFLGGRRLGRA